jgi:hypothetical protein
MTDVTLVFHAIRDSVEERRSASPATTMRTDIFNVRWPHLSGSRARSEFPADIPPRRCLERAD